MPTLIRTYPTGTLVDLEHPSPDVIFLEDVAHALSMACRYAGHVANFYSVAEHCLLVERLGCGDVALPAEMAASRWAFFMVDEAGVPVVGRRERLSFLLHDAAEAYLGDVTSPLKSLLPDYRSIEGRWQEVIEVKYGLSSDLRLAEVVQWADHLARELEQALLTRVGALPGRLDGVAPEELVRCMEPAEARRRFLARARRLIGWGPP